MVNSREQNRAVLTDGPVGSTIVRLTFQMTAGILGMVAFNLTDTFFVSRLGTSELAALSFTFAVVLVLTRLAMGIGIGASSVISRAIGVGDWRSVRRITTDSLILSISLVIVLSAVGLTTIRPLFRLLGASDEILPLVSRYMKIWYFGLPFVVFPMVSNNAIRATGDMKTPALIMLTAVAVNGMLDPLLIFGIGPFPRMGLEGAATATVIGRAVTFTVSFYVVFRRLGMITFEKPSLSEMIDSWKKILFIGLPSAATRIILPLGIGVVTRIAAEFGPRAVAAIGVSYRVEVFALAVVMALSSVVAPFVGQNWGAGNFGRMKEVVRFSNRFASAWGAGMCVLLVLLARPIAMIFSKDPEVISGIVLYLRIVPISYFSQGIFRLAIGVLNVIEMPFHAAVLGIAQVFILTMPLCWAGARLYGFPGVFLGIGLAYLLTGAVSYRVLSRGVEGIESKRAMPPEAR